MLKHIAFLALALFAVSLARPVDAAPAKKAAKEKKPKKGKKGAADTSATETAPAEATPAEATPAEATPAPEPSAAPAPAPTPAPAAQPTPAATPAAAPAATPAASPSASPEPAPAAAPTETSAPPPSTPAETTQANVATESASASGTHHGMFGGATLGKGMAIKAQVNGGRSLLRGAIGVEVDLALALTDSIDLGITARVPLYQWYGATPGVKLRVALMQMGRLDLGLEATLAVPLLFHPGLGFSPGITLEPGLAAGVHLGANDTITFGFSLLPILMFNYYPSTLAFVLGFDPNVGYVHRFGEVVSVFARLDVMPFLDFTQPAQNPRFPRFSINGALGVVFALK